MITTYGVGSLIAVENESFVVAGTDSWNVKDAPEVFEHRLAKVLGVKSFRLPPASDERSKDGVHVRRFPLWHSCPKCGALQHVRGFNSPAGRNECGDCQEDLVPSRFVLVCADGHLADFPYWKWVHRKNRESGGAGLCGGSMRLRSSGRTASLRSILISCTCGVEEVSMEGAFRRTALSELNIRCEGESPWLKDAASVPCSQTPRTLQRGSSAAWHPVVRSALSIPPWSDGLMARLRPDWPKLLELKDSDLEVYLKALMIREAGELPVEAVRALLRAEREGDTSTEEEAGLRAYTALRKEEYRSLESGHSEQDSERDEEFVCEAPGTTSAALARYGFEGPMLVKRLREVRVLKAFSRVDAPDSNVDVHEAPLSHTRLSWLPAMEVRGEGVFLRLDRKRVARWADNTAVAARADRIRRNHRLLLRERAADPAAAPDSPVTPRLVLLHTLAHVLINEWSLDGGYPAASLRERLYFEDEMAGLLVYTATSDSEGSLGGVVAQGEPGRLATAVESALYRAEWCSADPLCVESEANGVGSVNLAACHACVLLPETSCEHNNGFLDRAMLVGTAENRSLGFFSDVLPEI